MTDKRYHAMLPQGFYTVRYSDGTTISNVPVEEAIEVVSQGEVDVILYNRFLLAGDHPDITSPAHTRNPADI